MKIDGKDIYVQESRFMAAETILGAALSGNIDLAKDLLKWTDKSDVFIRRENNALWQMIFACQTYAWRIPFVRNWLQDKLNILGQDESMLFVVVHQQYLNFCPATFLYF